MGFGVWEAIHCIQDNAWAGVRELLPFFLAEHVNIAVWYLLWSDWLVGLEKNCSALHCMYRIRQNDEETMNE